MKSKRHLIIAYIGGGSRQWARNMMSDLALDDEINGEVRLYDIDQKAAENNVKVGTLFQAHPKAKSSFTYHHSQTLESALTGADFVIISILPATFKEMEIYTHHPESYGIYQSVGDTTGPAGVMRSLIAIPIFYDFAQKIKMYCPNAWVINFTNPMTMCLQALYEGFPEIKAYGNCHEVFGSQMDLADLYNQYVGDKTATKDDVLITVSGINHFTWITKATCFNTDLLQIYDQHVKAYGAPHIDEPNKSEKEHAPFGSASKVKYDLYLQFDCMAAAGDRHLAEFMPVSYYLGGKEKIKTFKFHLTPVSYRIHTLQKANQYTEDLIDEKQTFDLWKSGEEGVKQMKALMGLHTFVTNVNTINKGQAKGLPLGLVVETNALFRTDEVTPIDAGFLPVAVEQMVTHHMYNHKLVMESFRQKDLKHAKRALANEPLCMHLDFKEVSKMFDEMTEELSAYLDHYIQS
ncbi:MAG: alpha-glucosidase/alpha-galactosidase [Acholeplasmataceae bacterium]